MAGPCSSLFRGISGLWIFGGLYFSAHRLHVLTYIQVRKEVPGTIHGSLWWYAIYERRTTTPPGTNFKDDSLQNMPWGKHERNENGRLPKNCTLHVLHKNRTGGAGNWLTQSVATKLSSKPISMQDCSSNHRLSSLLSPPETHLVGFRTIMQRVSWAYVRQNLLGMNWPGQPVHYYCQYILWQCPPLQNQLGNSYFVWGCVSPWRLCFSAVV